VKTQAPCLSTLSGLRDAYTLSLSPSARAPSSTFDEASRPLPSPLRPLLDGIYYHAEEHYRNSFHMYLSVPRFLALDPSSIDRRSKDRTASLSSPSFGHFLIFTRHGFPFVGPSWISLLSFSVAFSSLVSQLYSQSRFLLIQLALCCSCLASPPMLRPLPDVTCMLSRIFRCRPGKEGKKARTERSRPKSSPVSLCEPTPISPPRIHFRPTTRLLISTMMNLNRPATLLPLVLVVNLLFACYFLGFTFNPLSIPQPYRNLVLILIFYGCTLTLSFFLPDPSNKLSQEEKATLAVYLFSVETVLMVVWWWGVLIFTPADGKVSVDGKEVVWWTEGREVTAIFSFVASLVLGAMVCGARKQLSRLVIYKEI
jgi:hypothetical protein